MRKYAIPAAALVLAVSSISFGQTITNVLTENFDDGNGAARWDQFTRESGLDPTVSGNVPDALVNFNYDYAGTTFLSYQGNTTGINGVPIAVAPAPSGGGTKAVRLAVNANFPGNTSATNATGTAAIMPKLTTISGDYRMTYDMFADNNEHPNGSTNVSMNGLNYDGTGVVGDNFGTLTPNQTANGYAFSQSTDGDNAGDYRVYTRKLTYNGVVDDGPRFAKKNATWTGTPGIVPYINANGESLGSNTNAEEAFNQYYWDFTPGNPEGNHGTTGNPLEGGTGKTWTKGTIIQRGKIVTFQINDKIVNTLFLPADSAVPATAKNSLGMADLTAGASNIVESYYLYDNISVDTYSAMPTNTIGSDTYARFNSGATVTVDGASTMNGLQFDTAGTTLAGTGAITFGTPAGAIYAANGNHVISKPLAFNASSAIYVDEGSTLAVTGATYAGSGSSVITKAGRGKLTLNGGIRARALQINTGTLAVTGGINKINLLNLSFQAVATTPDTGRLDVGRSIWIVDYTVLPLAVGVAAWDQSPFTAIANYINAGFNAGAYNGPGIISSDPDLLTPSPKLIIRAVEASAMGLTDSSTLGITGVAVDATSVLFGVTFKSDFNFDGSVEFQDLVKLAQNYNVTGLDPTTSWMQGDTNFDGSVEFQDLVLVAQTYNQSVGGLIGSADAFGSDWALAQSMVPEPTSLALLGLGGLAMGRRRR